MAEEIDPFEAAMGAMGGGDSDSEPAADAGPIDPFEAAMGALGGEGENLPAPTTGNAPTAFLPGFEDSQMDLESLMHIKLKVTFEVGRAKMYIADLLSLGQGSVIELHRLVGEELEIYVNGHLLATGEVVVVNEKFGARITKILTPHERVLRLGPQP